MVGLSPVPSAVAHSSLANRIRGHLRGSGWGASRLQIEDDGQAVTLRGIASSFYQRQVWLHRAKQAIGDIRFINDEISVDA
jgi:hypothetical protein